jgi:class 3 adenylate cyclase/tetratricopeptide (TPR) repeat protein
MTGEKVKCSSCQGVFTWDEAYKCQETPGSTPYNPPGQGEWRPRVFCPHCGELVAEWHITRQKDFDEWLWFGDNEKYNTGCPLPPSPIVHGWGRNIPPQFLPMFKQHRIDTDKITQYQKTQESVSEPDGKKTQAWKEPFKMAKQFYAKGDIRKVVELIQEADKAGLPKLEHAEALGVIGDHYLLEKKDVETARKYYESSIKIHFSGYWVAHLFIGYMHEAEGNIQAAKKEYDDAKRANPHKLLEPALEAEVRQIVRKWGEQKLAASPKLNIDNLTGKKDIQGLIKALKHDDEPIRWAAAKALGEVGNQEAIGPLIEALKDKEEDVRWYAAMSLGKIGDERAIEALTQSMEDKSKLVGQFSKNAIDEIKERLKIRTDRSDEMEVGGVDDMKSADAVIDAGQKHEDSDYQKLGKPEDIVEDEYSEPAISISGESPATTAYDVKRKLAAILSADVQGYSLLMQEDEVGTVRTLTDYRKLMSSLIRQFKGRVVDSPGDNVLAEFASVVDAAQCAMEIQTVLRGKNELLPENRRMNFRIGINLGDVIEEGERIYGDGVNIAARIEGLSEAGGICISGSAYEQIENKLPLSYKYLGEHSVKNIRKPIKVYRAVMGPKLAPTVHLKRGFRLRRWRWAALTAGVVLASLTAIVVIRQNYQPHSPRPVEVPTQPPVKGKNAPVENETKLPDSHEVKPETNYVGSITPSDTEGSQSISGPNWDFRVLSVENTGKQKWKMGPVLGKVYHIGIKEEKLCFWRIKAEVKRKKRGLGFDSQWIKLTYRVHMGEQKSVEAVASISDLMGQKIASAGSFTISFGRKKLSEPLDLDLLFLAPKNSSDIKYMDLQFLDYAKVRLIPK